MSITPIFGTSTQVPNQEKCYWVLSERNLTFEETRMIMQILADPLTKISLTSRYQEHEVVNIGPRCSIETPTSSNFVGIFRSLNLPVTRVEVSTRYVVPFDKAHEIAKRVMDPMTEEVYGSTVGMTFSVMPKHEAIEYVKVLEEGASALVRANASFGLGMDQDDILYYTQLFQKWGRNPTLVECTQLGNANSEHSRHFFFRGKLIIDGVPMEDSLMDIVQQPWLKNPGNSLTAFHDNAGVIRGRELHDFVITSHRATRTFSLNRRTIHPSATAETHNHPTLVAPFPGAETGAGGRVRDNRAVGRGGRFHVGFSGYCVGTPIFPDYRIPGEFHPEGFPVVSGASAVPLDIMIKGSDGISDYGNKLGEPNLGGFARSGGLMVGGLYRAFQKPILYSAGLGSVSDRSLRKNKAFPGLCIVRIGGPAYPIGVGGGSASSIIHGHQSAALDLKSVQRGDAQMENRVNRVIQEYAQWDFNPIVLIHDQGAGGLGNVLTEMTEPLGGTIDISKLTLGDRSMSFLEKWVAEFQESYGLLIDRRSLELFHHICKRENVPLDVLGEITNDGVIKVHDPSSNATPINLPLVDVLSEMPQKHFKLERMPLALSPFVMPSGITIEDCIKRTFAQTAVASKGHLVCKVDQSVSGRVVRPPRCGPAQVPVADASVVVEGFFDSWGSAAAFGEQPWKMLINPQAGARMAVAEMLTNLASVKVESLDKVRVRANWMWAAKLPGEGPRLYDAAVAMSDFMVALGCATDGGKDSLSMATKVGTELIVAPGQLVIMGYAVVPNVNKIATPDLKSKDLGPGKIALIDLGLGKNRLGGSSLAQSFGQLGNESPDIDDVALFKRAWMAVQEMIEKGVIRSYHDRSDGGLIAAIAEMCIAGQCGATLRFKEGVDLIAELFSEEAGMLFEYAEGDERVVTHMLRKHNVRRHHVSILSDGNETSLAIQVGEQPLWSAPVGVLRSWWEETSHQYRALQSNPDTARQEKEHAKHVGGVEYKFPTGVIRSLKIGRLRNRPPIAVIREEGSNGDREMAAACYAAGLDPIDITMNEIREGNVSLDRVHVSIFTGGFSFADVGGSAKGWAASFRFHPKARELFRRFFEREDTYSLGICNGAQLSVQIGLVPQLAQGSKDPQAWLTHNTSGRFESRWSAVRVEKSPAVLMKGMEGLVCGIHVAHGEGKFMFPDPVIQDQVWEQGLVPLTYVDMHGNPTESYPYNPNGSPKGMAALCSKDGRHLAMMPHPERAVFRYQWAWMPPSLKKVGQTTPWLQIFANARTLSLKS